MKLLLIGLVSILIMIVPIGETKASDQDVRKARDPNMLVIAPNAISIPVGRILLVRKESNYCAIKFTET